MARSIVGSRPIKKAESLSRRRPLGSKAELIADLSGLLLLCTAATWTFASALVSRSDPLAFLILLSTIAGGTILGRLTPGVAPMVVLGLAAVLLAADPLSFVSRDAASFGFDYENAKGAYLVQVAAAGFLVARWSRSQRLRTAALTGTIIFGVTPFFFGSLAAGILGSILVGLSLATAGITRKAARLLVLALAGVLLITIAGTMVMGSTYASRDDSQFVGSAVNSALSERRRLLWADALDALQEDPLLGAGAGSFEQTSALARSEEDVQWVPSFWLEQAAEVGFPGLLLVILIFGWGFVRLVVGGRPAWLVVTGAAALFAIGVHASIDYILHFPIVPLAAGAIFGSATSAAWEKD